MPDGELVYSSICFGCLCLGELLAPRPKPKQEDHALSAVRDCLFNTFAAKLSTKATVVQKVAGTISVLSRYDQCTKPITSECGLFVKRTAKGTRVATASIGVYNG